MTDAIPEYYWDTCVFIAFLNDDRVAYGSVIDDIQQFLDESQRGECRIYCSTITIAEITRDKMQTAKHADFQDFLKSYENGVISISPDPNIMTLASELRSLTYTKTGGTRKLLTPDAIHLASAVALQENYRVPITAFHTFDNGKNRGPEGPGTPLLSFETWCEQCQNDPLAQKVINMNRCRPEHPNKKLPLSG